MEMKQKIDNPAVKCLSTTRKPSKYEKYFHFFTDNVLDVDSNVVSVSRKCKCKLCQNDNTVYDRSTNARNAMLNHLEKKHPKEFLDFHASKSNDSTQPKIDKLFKQVDKKESAKLAMEYLLVLFSVHSLSLCLVDKKEFKDFVTATAQAGEAFELPSSYIMKQKLMHKFEEQRSKYAEMMHLARSVSIIFDGWSSKAMNSYVGLIIRFFYPPMQKVFQFCWDLIPLGAVSHTAGNLASVIRTSMPTGVRIFAGTTDTAENVTNCV